jgi:GNAT superfamily N-acetyltransferase
MNNISFSIRPIRADDKDSLQLALNQMTSQSRRSRFFSGRLLLSEKELAYFTEVDQVNHIAFVALTDESLPAGSIRCVRSPDRANYAELAITIIDKYHRLGLGFQMFEILATAAIAQNITYFFGDFQNSNTQMLKLLEKYKRTHHLENSQLELRHTSDGFLSFEISLT